MKNPRPGDLGIIDFDGGVYTYRSLEDIRTDSWAGIGSMNDDTIVCVIAVAKSSMFGPQCFVVGGDKMGWVVTGCMLKVTKHTLLKTSRVLTGGLK